MFDEQRDKFATVHPCRNLQAVISGKGPQRGDGH
jgi:hypothetical protein